MQIEKKKLAKKRIAYLASKEVQLILLVLDPTLTEITKMLVTRVNQLFLVSLPGNSSRLWSRWKLLGNLEMTFHMVFPPMLFDIIFLGKCSWERTTLQ